MMRIWIFFFILFPATMSYSQKMIPLYEGKVPNSRPTLAKETTETSPDGHTVLIHQVTEPTLSIFLPDENKATGIAVVICPGGGYQYITISYEGIDVAKKLNQQGIAAFVLKYRIPSDQTMIDKEIGPLQDAQRAIQIVRARAKEWNIKKDEVGILGFSAGGHLASTLGTHLGQIEIKNKDQVSLRPDFMILIYPVISFTDSIGHQGSRDQLIGQNPSPEKIKAFSNEFQVTSNTPPTYLVHAEDDLTVPVKNSLYFYQALQKNHVAAQIYLYPKGGHGFGMINPTSDLPWIDLVTDWIKSKKWKSRASNP
jgi:acetyl esterase/lipase